MLGLLSDTKELSQVFDLYGLKLAKNSQSKDIEDENQTTETTEEELDVLTEANKAYYNYVLDRAWAQDIL